MTQTNHKQTIIISHHNIRSIKHNHTDLLAFLEDHSPDIMTFNETWLKKGMKYDIPEYKIFRNDRTSQTRKRGGGIAIAVKENLAYQEIDDIQLTAPTNNEQLTIAIRTDDKKTLFISTIYCPKGSPSIELIEGLLDGRENVVLTGDFNSKHQDLGNDKQDKSGHDLVEVTRKLGMTLINAGTPTYRNDKTGKDDVNDLIFISPSLFPCYKEFWVGEDLGSDHSVITGVLYCTPVVNRRPDRTIRLYHKANWKDINDIIMAKMDNSSLDMENATIQDIDTYVDKLTTTITSTVNDKVPTKSIKGNSIGIPKEIRDLITQKRHIRRLWQTTRDEQHKTAFNRLQKQVKKAMISTRKDNWHRYCNDMELAEGQDHSWRKLKSVLNPKTGSLSYPTLVSTNSKGGKTRATTTSEKLDTFASQMEQIFTEDGDTQLFDDNNRTRIDNLVQYKEKDLTFQDNIPFDIQTNEEGITLAELMTVFSGMNPKKTGGPDNINNKLIIHLIPSLVLILPDLYNTCLYHGYHPKAWKHAWALMIPKPNKKKSDPGSYRPVSLLSSLGKVFESIVTTRLYEWAENTKQLQSGFRKHHSTNDKLYELTQVVSQALNRHGKKIGTLFLDINKAFDRVWHNGLIYKLPDKNAPALLTRWILNFLKDRTMQVRILGNASRGNRDQIRCTTGQPNKPAPFHTLHLRHAFTSSSHTRR